MSDGTLPLVLDILLLGVLISDSKVPFIFAYKLKHFLSCFEVLCTLFFLFSGYSPADIGD